jgi:hypothetical protein
MTDQVAKPASASKGPSATDRDPKALLDRFGVAVGVTAGALVLLGLKLWLQVVYPALRLDDSLSAGLLIVAAFPWLAQLLTSAKFPGGWEFVFRELKENQQRQEGLLLDQQEQIQALRTAVRGIVTKHEYDKLVGLNQDGPFLCRYSDDMFDELKRLRALNLISHHEGTGLANMARDNKGRDLQFDLKKYFHITDEGKKYMKIRGYEDDQGPSLGSAFS